MKYYQLLKTNLEFQYVLVGHSYIHPISLVQEIEELLKNSGYVGEVLLDGLLSNGFSDKRFAKVFFDGASFDMLNVELVEYPSDDLDYFIYIYYMNNQDVIDDDNILAEYQKYLLKNGVIIKGFVTS